MSDFPPTKPADAKIQKFCDQLKTETEKLILPDSEHFEEFTSNIYTNKSAALWEVYLIKVFTGNRRYVHIRVNEELPSHHLHLVDAKYPMTMDDPLVSF